MSLNLSPQRFPVESEAHLQQCSNDH